MPCEFNPDLFSSSSSFKDDNKSDNDNTDDKLTESNDEKMKKTKNFDRFD